MCVTRGDVVELAKMHRDDISTMLGVCYILVWTSPSVHRRRAPMIRVALLATLVLVTCSTASSSGNFYSIDISTNNLVSIDANQGKVTLLGAIEYGGQTETFHNVDLAFANGTLYALNSTYNGGMAPGKVWLLAIDPLSRVVESKVQIQYEEGGTVTYVPHAEGLARDSSGALFVVFNAGKLDAGQLNRSYRLGRIDLGTGIISPPIHDYLGFEKPGDRVDSSGMTHDPNGDFLWVDSESAGQQLIEVGSSPKSYKAHDLTGASVLNDAAWTESGELWGIAKKVGSERSKLFKMDPASKSVLKTLPLKPKTAVCLGLAQTSSNDPVPEPPIVAEHDCCTRFTVDNVPFAGWLDPSLEPLLNGVDCSFGFEKPNSIGDLYGPWVTLIEISGQPPDGALTVHLSSQNLAGAGFAAIADFSVFSDRTTDPAVRLKTFRTGTSPSESPSGKELQDIQLRLRKNPNSVVAPFNWYLEISYRLKTNFSVCPDNKPFSIVGRLVDSRKPN